MNTIKFSPSSLSLLLASILSLSACGGSDQDIGEITNAQQVFGGRAIDGYIARATVYIDTNNNATRDAWEPYAFTDDQGYYSYNPITDTNYCAEDAQEEQAQYCLQSTTEYASAVIRIHNGYDVLTGEPFIGQLSHRVYDTSSENLANLIITPITSLLTHVSDSGARSNILMALGITEEDLSTDYLNTDGLGSIDEKLVNASLKVHKVVSILSDTLGDVYTDIGDEINTPNDASNALYLSLAEQLSESSTSIDEVLANVNVLALVLDGAEQNIQDVYANLDLDAPAPILPIQNTEDLEGVIADSIDMIGIINELIPVDEDIDEDEATAAAKLIEVATLKAIEADEEASGIQEILDFIEQAPSEQIDALLDALAEPTSDLSALVSQDFADDSFDSVEEIEELASLAEDAAPFSNLAGNAVRISELDLGDAPDDLEDSEVEFYFSGDLTGSSGGFSACVKYIDGASSDGTLGEGNTRGELVDGFWSLLGNSSSGANVESYSLLLTMTFLGATYQAIVKPDGIEEVDGINYTVYRYDNNGEIEKFYSLDGVVPAGIVPTNNQACEERLPSRVGI